MTTFKRICIKDFEITAKNGDYFEIKRGSEYLTSDIENGEVIVLDKFWVPVSVEYFAGEIRFT